MRRAVLWMVAVCVGFVAAKVLALFVELQFGIVSGGPAIVYGITSLLVFSWTTAAVVTWLGIDRLRR